MTPDELEEEYFRAVGAAPRDDVRARELLSEVSATYAMLLNGMCFGFLAAWLHPTTSLLWVECGRNLAALMRAATPKVPHTQLLTAVSLRAGLGEAVGLGCAGEGCAQGAGGSRLAAKRKPTPVYLGAHALRRGGGHSRLA